MPKVAAKKSYRIEQTVDEDGVIIETPVEEEDDGTPDNEKRKAELLGILGELEKTVRVNAVSFGSEGRMDTGLLCLNQMMGGGLAPGMYVLVGPEQSAKTTAAITMAAASVDQETDIRCLWDAEGSSGSSIDYIANIFSTVGVKNASIDTVFGVREGGKYTTVPTLYYRDDYEAEKFFNWVHGLEKRLPDKRFEDGEWWYVYDDAKDVMKLKARLGSRVDKRMTARNAGVWVKAEHAGLQAVIICDSIPALVPPSMDEEEGDNSIAVNARFLSKQLPRIKGALRAKRIALVFINQLRLSPMVKYGSPEVEPGGNAPKFFSDVRLKLYPNALSSAPFAPKGEGQFETEPSVTYPGMTDTYRYISVKTIKNKLSSAGGVRTTWLRLWVSDGKGDARGYDPVFDCFYYLWQTGQVVGKRSLMHLNLSGIGEAKKSITWQEFKTIILGSKADKAPILEKIGYKKDLNLRRGCLGQQRRGTSETLYQAWIATQMVKAREKAKADLRTPDKD